MVSIEETCRGLGKPSYPRLPGASGRTKLQREQAAGSSFAVHKDHLWGSGCSAPGPPPPAEGQPGGFRWGRALVSARTARCLGRAAHLHFVVTSGR